MPIQVKAEYDEIATDYLVHSELPMSIEMEQPSLLKQVGDIQGMRVLDLACGDGRYSRLYHQMGATDVGVDLSETQIKMAKSHGSNIEYHVGDCTDLSELQLGVFDMVTASFLLNYASSETMLMKFVKTIATHLKSKGKFVSLNCNPIADYTDPHRYAKYGYIKYLECDNKQNAPIGCPLKVILTNGETKAEFYNYYMPLKCHEDAFRECGMSFKLVPLTIPTNSKLGHEYWDPLKGHTPSIVMEAVKRE
eukprot:NODE_462_length_7167_cov_0.402518.p4 type:complete len:250 gc:universal NODE_462_length_7167_cov_0.402518:3899-3150(-)